MNRVAVGLAVGAGYLLGRTKKAKLALAVGTAVAGRRLRLNPGALAGVLSQQLEKNPQFKEIGDQLREDLRGVGKAATGSLLNRSLEGLADRLHERTLDVRDQMAGVTPDRQEKQEEEDEEEEPEASEDSQGSEESQESEASGETGKNKKASGRSGSAASAPRKRASASRRSASGSTSARRSPAQRTKKTAKKSTSEKPAKKSSTARTARTAKSAAKKTAEKTAKPARTRGGRDDA